MTLILNKERKLSIFRELIKTPHVLTGTEPESVIELLDHVFNLRTKPSRDPRFDDAYGDAFQHLVSNNDWDLEYVFLERFDIIEGNHLIRLIEYIIRPGYQPLENDRLELVEKLILLLEKDNFTLETSDYSTDNLPLFTISDYDRTANYPVGVARNQFKILSNYDYKNVMKFKPMEKEVFILDFKAHSWWNDYSMRSRCNLLYRDSSGNLENFGELKIITNNLDNYSPRRNDLGDYQNFKTIVPDSFLELDNSYCSLGQDRNYYLSLKETYPARYKSILYALKDAAVFTDIADAFENNRYYKDSLIRTDRAERIIREIRHELNGKQRSDLYHFNYLFSPKFSNSDIPPIPISFNFEDVSNIPNRICAIIGKNGVGKTQFISRLPKDLAKENQEYFEGEIPLFSKVIALSYSPFDMFEPAKSGANIEYIFCSLRDEKGDISSENSRAIKFGKARKRIQELERIQEWYEILQEFLPQKFLNDIFFRGGEGELSVDEKVLNKVRKALSSGQRILLETVTNIIAHIRYDSLLLFDEPETHLHPNAIALLMNTIYELVKRFESFCIITTHSPIIVRELFSRNVYVMDKEEELLSVRKVGLECFGANLSDITEEIFGVNEIPKHYQQLIRRLKEIGLTEKKIIESIQSDDIPLSLHLRLFIKSIYSAQE